MKKLKLITKTAIVGYTMLVAVIFCGCETKNITIEETITKINGRQISVYVIDSCEYIGFSGTSDGGTSIIHKQNCKFCAKRSEHNCN